MVPPQAGIQLGKQDQQEINQRSEVRATDPPQGRRASPRRPFDGFDRLTAGKLRAGTDIHRRGDPVE